MIFLTVFIVCKYSVISDYIVILCLYLNYYKPVSLRYIYYINLHDSQFPIKFLHDVVLYLVKLIDEGVFYTGTLDTFSHF